VAFYYTSLFSMVPLGIAYTLLAFLYMVVVFGTRGRPKRAITLTVVGALFLILPVSEELWIAWNFARACKQSGTVIHKTVQADGFYSEGAVDMTRLVGLPFEFVESKLSEGGYQRIERGQKQDFERAIAWYRETRNGKSPGPKEWIKQPIDDQTTIVAELDTGHVWRITKLDRPTARYHFRKTDPMDGTPWGYKIGRSGSVVVDTKNNEEIARYTSFGRRPPWYFLGLSVPPYACDSPGKWPNTDGSSLIYRNAIVPTKNQ
jgi:hypothetical protein